MPEESKPKRTLWLLECYNGFSYELFPLYALSQEDAQSIAQKLISEAGRPLKQTSLRAYPGGFLIYRKWLKGTL